jgi:hypothetical protein
MKKIISLFYFTFVILLFTQCGEKEKLDTSKAPAEIKSAINESLANSKVLTEIQLKAIEDGVIDSEEIQIITEAFGSLAIVNNRNKENYSKDKYFIALNKESKKELDNLAKATVKLKDCKGYNELWMSIQKKALEVKGVTAASTQ